MPGTIQGEAELIGTYLAPLAGACAGSFGLKDDCAAYSPRAGFDLVISTDAIAAGVHFFADDVPEDIGWKALAVNVSDLAAKGATPRVYQMALSFPDAPTRAFMAGLAKGLAEAQAAFGMVLSGGDTDRRPGPMSLTITAIGEVPAGRMPTRLGATPGDRLFVTGTLGDAALGLKLRRGDGQTGGWDLSDAERAALLTRYLRPAPRLEMRACLLTWATAAMDVSDGLAKDLGRLAAASGVGACIEEGLLPLSLPARRIIAVDPGAFAAVLGGGDDYEVLFAVAPAAVPDVLAWTRDHAVMVTEIGSLTEGRAVLFQSGDGSVRTLVPVGWEHF